MSIRSEGRPESFDSGHLRRHRLRSGTGVAVLALALVVLAASSAQAIAIYASGPQFRSAAGVGFDKTDIQAALAAGVQQLPDSIFFSGNAPGDQLTAPASPAGPIPGVNVPNGTKANPSTGSGGLAPMAIDNSYQNLWLVIQGHDFPSDPLGPFGTIAQWYTDSTLVGLDIDPNDPRWAIVRSDPAVDPYPNQGREFYYLAYFIGPLPQGQSANVPLSYAVAQGLYEGPTGVFTFPQYRVAFLDLAVPEPSLAVLLAGAGLALALRRKRSA